MAEKKVIITQSNYIPWKGYFDSLQRVDQLVLLDDVQFTRRDWRNRNKIKTQQGPQWLTIPVQVKGKFSQSIRETQVSDPSWGERHWKTIQGSYARAQYFREFGPRFESLYLNPPSAYLSDINRAFIEAICSTLGIKIPISWSDEFEPTQGKTDRLIDLCLKLNATDYYSGPAAQAYIDLDKFSEAGIRVHYLDYSGYPEYAQLWGPFDHFVSVLDLIFNEGPGASGFLKYSKKQT